MKLTVPASYLASLKPDAPPVRHFTTAVVSIAQTGTTDTVLSAVDRLNGIEYRAWAGRLWKPVKRVPFLNGQVDLTQRRPSPPLHEERIRKDVRAYRSILRAKAGLRFDTAELDRVLDIHALFSAERMVEQRLGRLGTRCHAEPLPIQGYPGSEFAVNAARMASQHLLLINGILYEETVGPVLRADLLPTLDLRSCIWLDASDNSFDCGYRWAFHRSREFLEAASHYVPDDTMERALNVIGAIEIHAPEHLGLVDVAALEAERFGWLALQRWRRVRPGERSRDFLAAYVALRSELVAMSRVRGIEASGAIEYPVFARDSRTLRSEILAPCLQRLHAAGSMMPILRNWLLLDPDARNLATAELADFVV